MKLSEVGRVPSVMTRYVVILLVAVMLGGCAGSGFWYARLDWLVALQASQYVSLDGPQRQAFRRELDVLLAWHCTAERPRLVDLADTLAVRVAGGPGDWTADEVHALVDEIETRWHAVLTQAAPALAGLLRTLDAEQQAELMTALRDDLAEDRAEYLDGDAAERDAAREARMRERLERWLGPLTPAQETLLAQWQPGAAANSADDWLAHRAEWLDRFGRALAGGWQAASLPERGAAPASLETLIAQPDHGRSADSLARRAAALDAAVALTAQVLSIASADQRAHFADELADLADGLRGVRCEMPPPEVSAVAATPRS